MKQKGFMDRKTGVFIELFEMMYDILEENKCTEAQWAEASGLDASRISDYKRKARKTKTGASEGTKTVLAGRRLTSEKLIELGLGLRRVVGDTEFKRGMIKELDGRELPSGARVFVRMLAFTDDQIRQVDSFTDVMLRSSDPSF